MTDDVEALVVDLLLWIGPQPRPYDEVLDAWKTSCPHLPVWEEVNARGLVQRVRRDGEGATAAVTDAGREFLRRRGCGFADA